MKKIGILLPIFALPTKYGIGDFGPSAYQFIDILKNNNLNCWEVLPINPVDEYNSPYSPLSSMAIEPLYISLDLLKEWKLLNCDYSLINDERINYELVKNQKDKYLRIAFNNLSSNNHLYNEYLKYAKEKNEYAMFVALKCANNDKSWRNFTNDYDIEEYKYQLFLQFIALKQWFILKKYANDNAIEIIGDLPIYVNYESSDVYFNQDDFLLENKMMKYVSGASPDYFNINGQKWGHPLYDFNHQKLNNYQYFLDKYLYTDKLFDVIRIDHFKAFDAFYKIPIASDPIAGEWIKSPGKDILKLIFKYVDANKYIVEDLGTDLNSLYELRDNYRLKGMKIFEYCFDFKLKRDNCINTSNMIVYPGNHDNNTILGWYNNLTIDEQNILNNFLIDYKGTINQKIIKYLLNQPAQYVVFMIQDVLELDEKARINVPGIENNQWNYQLKNFNNIDSKLKQLFNE